MSLRAAQQYVQVVGIQQQDGELRVRRMYIDVLESASIREEAVNNILSFTHDTHGWVEEKEFTSNLYIAQNVSNELILKNKPFPDSTLNLTSSASATRDRVASATSNIVFNSVIGRARTANASSTLSVAQTLEPEFFFNDRDAAGNTLNITQTVLVSSNPVADNTLNFTQSVSAKYPTKVSINDFLSIHDHITTPYRAWIEDTLSLSDLPSVPIPQIITQNISFVQTASMSGIAQNLGITDTVTVGKSYRAETELDLTHEMDVTGIFMRSVNQDAGIGHALTWYEFSYCGKKQYKPHQGENTISDASQPNPVLRDPQGNTDTFSLYKPYLGVATSTVTLRKPELDNRDRNAYTRVNNETRGGKIIVYSDPDWPQVRTLAVTIVGLTEDKVDELHSFMQDTIGEMIGLDDWEGRLWKGYITNPNEPATQDGRKSWTISFEFEGEMLEVENPSGPDGMSMNLSQSVSVEIV